MLLVLFYNLVNYSSHKGKAYYLYSILFIQIFIPIFYTFNCFYLFVSVTIINWRFIYEIYFLLSQHNVYNVVTLSLSKILTI